MAYDSRSLGPQHLAADLKWEPQRTNNFQLNIFGLPGQGTEMIMLALVSFSLPTISNDPISVKHGNTDVKFAGVTQWQGSNSLQVNDYITTDMSQIISDWRALVYNPVTDAIGWAVEYKKTGEVVEFGPDGTFYRTWHYEGLWPNEVNFGELSHDGNDIRKIEMTIQYDRAYRV